VRTEVSPRIAVFSIVAAALAIPSNGADARYHLQASQDAHHFAHAEGYSPPSSSIVVDGNTGKVLQELNPDAPRHPASLTKIMTLYLLFERLDAHKIKLDTPLKVSAKAAEQPSESVFLATDCSMFCSSVMACSSMRTRSPCLVKES
jgi:D-alanyl-D-alanine carboxypeptidase